MENKKFKTLFKDDEYCFFVGWDTVYGEFYFNELSLYDLNNGFAHVLLPKYSNFANLVRGRRSFNIDVKYKDYYLKNQNIEQVTLSDCILYHNYSSMMIVKYNSIVHNGLQNPDMTHQGQIYNPYNDSWSWL
jgi:hypothetical protein